VLSRILWGTKEKATGASRKLHSYWCHQPKVLREVGNEAHVAEITESFENLI
jgi:hypothetical protein